MDRHLDNGNHPDENDGLLYEMHLETTPPDTTITSGPAAPTNDPTPTFSFSSSESGSSFECKVDSGAYAACSSPRTVAHLADGSHTFYVRAMDAVGNVDPTPATRSFTVRTAEVRVSGSTLVVTAAAGAKDNLVITKPTPSTLRVTDAPSGSYTGSGVHTGSGCTRSGDYTANCSASGINQIQVSAGDQTDKVTNSTAVKSTLFGGVANDLLTGGSASDTLFGGDGRRRIRGDERKRRSSCPGHELRHVDRLRGRGRRQGRPRPAPHGSQHRGYRLRDEDAALSHWGSSTRCVRRSGGASAGSRADALTRP